MERDPGPRAAAGPYNRLVRRFGGTKNPAAKKKAILAIAHTLLKIAYQVLKTGTPYQDLGADFYTWRQSPQHRRAWLERQLQDLHPGFTITISPRQTPPRRAPYHPTADPIPLPQPPGAAASPGTAAHPPDEPAHRPALATAPARAATAGPNGTQFHVSRPPSLNLCKYVVLAPQPEVDPATTAAAP
jgi:hypothetical protein